MPQPRPSAPRPKTGARPQSARAAQAAPPLSANEIGVQRRALKRARRRRNNVLAWGSLALATTVISGALGAVSGSGGVWSGAAGIWHEYRNVRQKISVKRATLADLNAQLDRKERRVKALDTPEGKERALVEGGYLGDGERFLLFPKSKDKPQNQ